MSTPIYRCTMCGKDTTLTTLRCCVSCGSRFVEDRTQPHTPDWSRHTANSMICKICDRIISDEYYMNAPERRLGICNPVDSNTKLHQKWTLKQTLWPDKTCTCAEFKKAQERGTDNEGYGTAVYHSHPIGYLMGYELQPINYCPWCGKNVPKPKEAK